MKEAAGRRFNLSLLLIYPLSRAVHHSRRIAGARWLGGRPKYIHFFWLYILIIGRFLVLFSAKFRGSLPEFSFKALDIFYDQIGKTRAAMGRAEMMPHSFIIILYTRLLPLRGARCPARQAGPPLWWPKYRVI